MGVFWVEYTSRKTRMPTNKLLGFILMEDLEIWDIASMAWTEIGLDNSEYPKLAEKLIEKNLDWSYINKIILVDVCGSFSIASASILLILIPVLGLFLITPIPDWGYEEEHLKEKIKKWKKYPIFIHFLNPARLIGYPLSVLMVLGVRKKLKKAYFQVKLT